MSSGSLVRAKGKTCLPIDYSPAHQRGDGVDLSSTENPPDRGMSVTSNTEMYIAGSIGHLWHAFETETTFNFAYYWQTSMSPLRWENMSTRFHNLEKHQIESTVVKDLAFGPVANIICGQGMAFHCSLQFGWMVPFWILEQFVWSTSRLSINATTVVIRDIHGGQLLPSFGGKYHLQCLPMLFPVNMHYGSNCVQQRCTFNK